MRITIIGFICLAAFMPACTTVSIGSNDAVSPIAQTATHARSAIKLSAQTLSYVFSREKWCPETEGETKQSAASILLRGLKKAPAKTDNVETYIQSTASISEVAGDITTARGHVEGITLQARAFLSDNPDVSGVKLELNALEKALIDARQAEFTFTRALEVKGAVPSSAAHQQLLSFEASIDDLRATTDAFGAMMRGQMHSGAAS